jgi:hypothetical protein
MAYYDALIAKWPTLTPGTVAARLAQLAAITVAVLNQPTTYGAIRKILKTGDNLDWATIYARSRQTPAFPPASATDAAILGAIMLVSTTDGDALDPTTGAWTKFNVLMANLAGAGDLSAGSTAAIAALITVQVPWWQSNGYSSTISASDVAAAGLS